MSFFDVIIIGSGPGGYVAAIRSAQLGMKTALIEKESLGGVCLNWGCIPTKYLLNQAKILHKIKKNQFFFSLNNKIQIDFPKIISNSRNIVKKMNEGVSFLMKKNGIHIIHGNAKLKNNKKIEVHQTTKKVQEYSASNIIIATGEKSKIDPNFKLDFNKIIDFKKALTLSVLPKKMIIVGSGSIGLEFASFYHSMGTDIIIIEKSSLLCPNVDEEISNQLKISLDKRGIKNYVSSFIKKINYTNKGSILTEISTSKKNIVIETDIILSAIGMIPNIHFLDLEQIGIHTNKKGYIIVDKNYQTNINGYYAIGDVINTPSLAHVATQEAIICIEAIKGLKPQNIDYNNIPKCVYCFPEIASVGYTEKQAKEQGYTIKIGKFPFSALGKSICDEETEGFVKVIFDSKYDEWLGCHMIGNNVTDLISEVVISRKLEATNYELLGCIHPHPSLSESILEAIANAYGRAIHL
ncbi:dihydrolipoyl dehydrogenase [Blattabacterium cuenoti]|uniref:dihydrolipoyl dehydrogenase n=1 Tax=Blattabacterium cuenoti TaxID=1653831 RepID=UPI00163C75DB|nr:dihydrolipoyl dehydrogenase [Blattabacterium cuenoti]